MSAASTEVGGTKSAVWSASAVLSAPIAGAGGPSGTRRVTGQAGVGVGEGIGVGEGRGVRVGVGVKAGSVGLPQAANEAAIRPSPMREASQSARREVVVGFIGRVSESAGERVYSKGDEKCTQTQVLGVLPPT